MTLRYRTNYRWHNHGRNLGSVVARYYQPSSAEEVQQIVREARRDGRTVRVVGDGHSWSPLALTDDYLVSTRRFNRILGVSSHPPRITVEPGVTVAQMLRACKQHGLCLPMNVDIPTLTIGGAVAVGANGFSRKWGTYSEFVQEVELVTGTGEIRTVNKDRDPLLWSAVACSLGLCGIFTRITLNLEPLFNVHVINRSVPMAAALAELDATFDAHDYVQYFWFPFNDTVTLQTADVTDVPVTWNGTKEVRKGARGWSEALATHLVHPCLVRFPRMTPLFDRVAARSFGNNEEVMTQCDNILLGPWINYMVPSLNASVSFPPGPGGQRMRDAWMTAVDLVRENAAAGRYPANLAMNMRLFGPSTALLHSVPGTGEEPACNIQITSFDNPNWDAFKDRLMEQWLQIPGSRPHWAKQYGGIAGIADRLRAVYGANLTAFLQIREEERLDPERIFVNPFLEDLLFGTQAALAHQVSS